MRLLLAASFVPVLVTACSGPRAFIREWDADKRRGFISASVDPMQPLPEPLVKQALQLMTERCAGPAKVNDEGVAQQAGAPASRLRDPFDRDGYGRRRPMFRQWDDEARVSYVYLWDFSCVEAAPTPTPTPPSQK